MSGVSSRHFLREREMRELLADLSRRLRVDAERLFGPEPRIEKAETPTAEVYLFRGRPALPHAGLR